MKGMIEKARRRRIRARFFAVYAAGCFAISGFLFNAFAFSQEKDQPVLQHEVSVVLKLIQVYVTDKEGKPVTDLNKEDFSIFDQGNPIEITAYERHVLGEMKTAEQTILGRKFILFFDFAFNTGESVDEARKAALYFIDHEVRPYDELALFNYSSIEYLKLHEYLTTDHDKVRKAVESLGLNKILGRAENVERLILEKREEILKDAKIKKNIDKMNKAMGSAIPKPTVSEDNNKDKNKSPDEMEYDLLNYERDEVKHRALSFAETMSQLAKALTYVSGKKNLLYFSSGIPASLYQGAMSGGERVLEQDNFLSDRYEKMIREFGAANCAVYAIHGIEDDRLGGKGDPGDLGRQLQGITSLQKFAGETGGKYFGNLRFFERTMDDIQNITGAYYVIGYPVREKSDGKFHSIKVSVGRKDCRVQNQPGYFNPKPFNKLTPLEKRIHFVDLALNRNPSVATGFPPTLDVKPCLVSGEPAIVFLVPIPEEGLRDYKGKKIEVSSIIWDDAGNLKAGRRSLFDFSRISGKNIFLYGGGKLPQGTYFLRIVIRNLETGKSSRADSSFSIEGRREKGITFFPPLICVPYRKNFPLFVKSAQLLSSKEDPTDFLADLAPSLDDQMTPLFPPYRIPRGNIHAFLQCRINDPQLRDLKFGVRFRNDADGSMKSPPCRMTYDVRADQIIHLTVEIDGLGVPEGRYQLEFIGQDKASGTLWLYAIPVEIE